MNELLNEVATEEAKEATTIMMRATERTKLKVKAATSKKKTKVEGKTHETPDE